MNKKKSTRENKIEIYQNSTINNLKSHPSTKQTPQNFKRKKILILNEKKNRSRYCNYKFKY